MLESAPTNLSAPCISLQNKTTRPWSGGPSQEDQAAFEGLVQRYQKVLYTVALRMLGNPDDAKDATQTAFVRAYERLATFNEQSQFFSSNIPDPR